MNTDTPTKPSTVEPHRSSGGTFIRDKSGKLLQHIPPTKVPGSALASPPAPAADAPAAAAGSEPEPSPAAPTPGKRK